MTKKRKAGGGRKPSREETKEPMSARLSPLVLRFCREQEQSTADVLEDAVRRTKAFKDWLKQQE